MPPTSKQISPDTPTSETDTMTAFYGANTCIVTRSIQSIRWAQILNAESESGSRMLKEMLDRHLREDPYPAHPAQVRENLIPLRSDIHDGMNAEPALWTLFLHEDIIARTLAYERDLKTHRLGEIEAGREDPGRPTYDEVFGGCKETSHRLHCAPSADPVVVTPIEKVYIPADCPGVEPYSVNQYPLINTLLSIPFSLLNNLPRLISIASSSRYHSDLVAMGQEIVSLWFWDPPRNIPPAPIFNRTATFEAMRPPDFDEVNAQSGVMQDSPMFQPSSSSQVLEGTSTGEQAEVDFDGTESDFQNRLSGEAMTGFEYSEGSSLMDEDKCCSQLLPSDILAWANGVIGGEDAMLPLTATPYEKGKVGGSMNDWLMIRGLIHPLVYVDYMFPEKFSN